MPGGRACSAGFRGVRRGQVRRAAPRGLCADRRSARGRGSAAKCADQGRGAVGRIHSAPEGYVRQIMYREQVSWWRRRARRQVVVRLRFAAVPAAWTLLSFGGDVEVVSPPEVHADLACVAAEVVACYSNMRLGMRQTARVSVSVRESLLDPGGEPVLGPLEGAVRRTPLARGAWVDLRPGWLAGSGAVFSRPAETVPWRAEKRHMYDRVVDVPRLTCFYDEAELPGPALTAELGAERVLRGGAGRAVPHGGIVPCAGTGGTASRGTATRPAGGRPGTSWSPSCRWARRGRSCCARGGVLLRYEIAWRPAGHGRQLPARLGARRAEDGPGRRAADQRAVPSRRVR
jgi:hypothetical protein